MAKKSAPEIFALSAETGALTVKLRKGLYPMDAVYGAAYVLIDRAYVLLDKDDKGNVLVHVQAKQGKRDEKDLRALAGDFANECLSQVLRGRIMKEHKNRIETIVAQAVAGGLGLGGGGGGGDDLGLDALDDDDDALDFLDDPLGIAVPWEEKYKKSAAEQRPETRADRPEGAAGPADSGGFQPVKPEGPSS